MANIRIQTTAAVVFLIITMTTATAFALDFSFKPFSDVSSVCPSCEAPKADIITLNNGTVVQGNVVAENPVFLTIVRFGEVRTVPTADVKNIKWKDGSKPEGIDSLDQIVIKNGHVLTGTIITENDTPAYFKIQSSYMEQTYTVFKSQVAKLFRNGRQAQ